MMPIVNVLTRTSGRPNYFAKCKESIENQTYKNINHIVSIDDNKSLDYIGDSNYIKVNAIPLEEIPELDKHNKAPYNLYLNELNEQVKDGWIIYLDDDDAFTDNKTIENIVRQIQSDDEILLWNVQFPNKIIPEKEFFGERPVINHFSMIGFMYHSKYIIPNGFDYYTGGDYTYITKLWDITPNKNWINEIHTKIQRTIGMGGSGKRDDLINDI